jgi:O-phosphoseryl-tRNA(Cys) synthetase
MSVQNFPPGWDDARVRDVLAHYESQSEDELFAEIEAALETEGTTLMAVPTDLVPEVRALLARAQGT